MKKMILVVLILILFSGCSTTAHIYPTKGPLTEQKPRPVLKAKVGGIMGNSGSIKLKMDNGDLCNGKWSVVKDYGRRTVINNEISIINDSENVSNDGHDKGGNVGEAFINCPDGTFIEIQFNVGNFTSSGSGVGKDNKGNKYKVIF